MSNTTVVIPDTNVCQSDNLAIISQWVKKDLFKKVKFVWHPEEDLKIREDGKLYQWFIKTCSARLLGMKPYASTPQSYRDMYLENLWTVATKKRKNLIIDGLNSRRSCIYSAMQNRFNGMVIFVSQSEKCCCLVVSYKCINISNTI